MHQNILGVAVFACPVIPAIQISVLAGVDEPVRSGRDSSEVRNVAVFASRSTKFRSPMRQFRSGSNSQHLPSVTPSIRSSVPSSSKSMYPVE